MVKELKKQPRHIYKKIPPQTPAPIRQFSFTFTFSFIAGSILLGVIVFVLVGAFQFEKTYNGKIYPGVFIDAITVGGKTQEEVETYFQRRSEPLKKVSFLLQFDQHTATISGKDLNMSIDGKFSAVQAFSIGRSGHVLSDMYQKWKAATARTTLQSVLTMNASIIDETLRDLSESIDITPQDALFTFEKGKVTAFKPAKMGRRLDAAQTKQIILTHVKTFTGNTQPFGETILVELPVIEVVPLVTTESTNDLGIRELIGASSSKFAHSIPGRIHNVELAASRIHGRLIPPGTIFSFNDALGDVSAATGFAPAYIIKDGRTVLGDGGGVCQVSTTLFRAALNTGLPIEERHAHAYRVSYYEQDSPPGLDATVFAPGYDLKFKNDTGHHILIQTKIDIPNYSLTFEMFGTGDGRKVEMTKPVILSQSPPPEDLFQDDPTIAKGVVKQVDFRTSGAKVNFDYKVTQGDTVTFQKSFFSNFRPWQAVFLRGTKEG